MQDSLGGLPQAPDPGEGICLLLADDDAGFRDNLHRLLMQRGEAGILGEAGDGVEAIPLAGNLRPDVVLMDLGMPRMNGLEATRRLRMTQPDVPVIILTVHDDEAYRRIALAAGAAAFLVKRIPGVDLWPTLVRIAGEAQRRSI